MRLLLVGKPVERARLRARVDSSIEIVGEFATVAAARASGLDADGILLAASERDRRSDWLNGEVEEETLAEPLTAREVEVLELLAEGLPNKAIATALGVSDQTVKFHVASISGKLGAANRTDAVRRAVRLGLIAL